MSGLSGDMIRCQVRQLLVDRAEEPLMDMETCPCFSMTALTLAHHQPEHLFLGAEFWIRLKSSTTDHMDPEEYIQSNVLGRSLSRVSMAPPGPQIIHARGSRLTTALCH